MDCRPSKGVQEDFLCKAYRASCPLQTPGEACKSNNIWRAKQAVQDGQYRKAIKALTSECLATPSEVIQEMLSKDPQAAHSLRACHSEGSKVLPQQLCPRPVRPPP